MEKENKTGIQELKNEAVEEAMKAFLADKTTRQWQINGSYCVMPDFLCRQIFHLM